MSIKGIVAKFKEATGSGEIEAIGKDLLESVKNIEDKVTSAREVVDAYKEKMDKLAVEKDDSKRNELAKKANEILKVVDKHFSAEKAELIKITESKLKEKGVHPLLVKRLDQFKPKKK